MRRLFSFVGKSVAPYKFGHILHMVRMWKHVDRLYALDIVTLCQKLQITRLGRRIATDIDYLSRSCVKQLPYHSLMHPGTWRVGDNNIGPTILLNKLASKHLGHITCKEGSVCESIALGIVMSISDCLFHILNTNHSLHLRREKQRDCSCTCV